MNPKTIIKKGRHVWAARDVLLGLSDTMIPAGTEGVMLTGVPVNGQLAVWWYTLGDRFHGVVPKDAVRLVQNAH